MKKLTLSLLLLVAPSVFAQSATPTPSPDPSPTASQSLVVPTPTPVQERETASQTESPTQTPQSDAAPTTETKKSSWSYSFIARVEQDADAKSDLLTSTTVVTATKSNGFVAETMIVKSKKTFNTYAYVGPRLFVRGTPKDTFFASLNGVGGIRTVAPSGGTTTLSIVVGVKGRLQYGRLGLSTPLTAFEQPVNRVRSQSQLVSVTKQSIRLTDWLTVFAEHTMRIIRDLPFRLTSGLYGDVKLTNTFTVSGGYYRNLAGIGGIRGEVRIFIP